jgi:hypothetical protein
LSNRHRNDDLSKANKRSMPSHPTRAEPDLDWEPEVKRKKGPLLAPPRSSFPPPPRQPDGNEFVRPRPFPLAPCAMLIHATSRTKRTIASDMRHDALSIPAPHVKSPRQRHLRHNARRRFPHSQHPHRVNTAQHEHHLLKPAYSLPDHSPTAQPPVNMVHAPDHPIARSTPSTELTAVSWQR